MSYGELTIQLLKLVFGVYFVYWSLKVLELLEMYQYACLN